MKAYRVALVMLALLMGGRGRAKAEEPCPVQPTTLRAMRGCYRPLLVFAPAAKSHAFVSQQALLEQYADDMMDRDLLYVPVLAENKGFERPLVAPYVMLKPSELAAVRARFQVGRDEFVVVLVGKDGGEKFRSERPVSVLKLDELVDSMPMGQREKSDRSK